MVEEVAQRLSLKAARLPPNKAVETGIHGYYGSGTANHQTFNPGIEPDVFDVLSLRGSLDARNVLGGTAPSQVLAQVARHKARLN